LNNPTPATTHLQDHAVEIHGEPVRAEPVSPDGMNIDAGDA
jgi:hypothetical protein